MIVENRAASRLLYMLIGPLSAQALQQKSSYLEGKLNKKIAYEKLTLIDNPLIKSGLGSRLYDRDGIAAKKFPVIENGILKNYYVDNYYGRKLGMEPTANGSSNLVISPGKKSLKDMIKNIDNGILVNSFNGGNSNFTTGDFSFGIGGMLIEKGKLTKPVCEMNISGNANEFWQKLIELGNDVFEYSSWLLPSLLFEDVYFAGL